MNKFRKTFFFGPMSQPPCEFVGALQKCLEDDNERYVLHITTKSLIKLSISKIGV